ncbi:MAG TPA: Ig-like domain-containing protein, partial [Gemmatimonadaceae bacterium]|nr:Ig-like domain-containing protein [Gemmatimonadaceae bacterium]
MTTHRVVGSLALGWLILSCAGADGIVGLPAPNATTAALVVTASYTEAFTGATGALAGSWAQQRTSGTINRNGSGLGLGSVNAKDLFAFWIANAFNNDQYSQARIAGGLSSGSQYVTIVARASGKGDGVYNGYLCYTDGAAGAGHTEVAKNINGSQTTLRSFATTFAAGDVIKIAVVGTTVTCYKNGVALGSVTDASLPGGSAGVGVYGSTVTVDDWEGGSFGTAVTPAPVASVTVSPSAASVVVGATQQLTATTKDSTDAVLTGRSVTWSSSNTAFATVDANGLVTGVAAGSATITATSEGKSGTSAITVTATSVPVATVTVDPTSASIVTGVTQQLTATTTDAAGNTLTGRNIAWTSDVGSVATVDASTGLVTGVGSGTATITATSEGKSGTAVITVTAVSVATVTVSPSSASVVVGNTQQLTAVMKDAGGAVLTGRNVTWSSGNAAATVDANGLVTTVSVGSATITATSEGKTGTSAITVTAVPVATVTVSPASSSVTAGATEQLTATAKDANDNVLTGRSITWNSNNTGMASVDANTGVVTGVTAGGPAMITATSEGKSGTASVVVTPAPVASVAVSPSSATVAVGGVQPLSATLKDANNNVLTGRSVVWSSDASSVASVNTVTGVVTGVGLGSARITATSEGKSGTSSITVTPASSSLPGPLHKSADNPRYFADPTGKVVYLTGSHFWKNVQDDGRTNPPPAFDNTTYLNFLQSHNHNFTRLWLWEQAKWSSEVSYDHWISPTLYVRTGPGTGIDGGLKFDLNQINQAYLTRLRQRVIDAGAKGIYVSVMLFDGWSIEKKATALANPWRGHPFNSANNINGINGDPNGDQSGRETEQLSIPAITTLQETYTRAVIDAVNDLDNVIYEISDESDPSAKTWQYHMINFIRSYEATKPKQHPIGMTVAWPNGSNADVLNSPADWVSMNGAMNDPVVATGTKVSITDTDHLCGICGDVPWVWKSLTRGHNPILMDGYDNSPGVSDPSYNPNDPKWEAIRKNLGYARSYALRMDLAHALPHGELASSGYCLAKPGVEYLVYSPGGTSVTVNLTSVPSTTNL